MTSRDGRRRDTANDNATKGDEVKANGAPEYENRAAEIARLAYEKWQARGCPEGDDRRDWFEAEQEVAAGRKRSTAGERATGSISKATVSRDRRRGS